MIREEQNMRIHVVAFLIVMALAALVRVTIYELIALLIVSGLVLFAELLNTLLERVVDILKPRIHPFAESVKDMMAASVMMTALLAVIVGLLVFVPAIIDRGAEWGWWLQ